MSALLEGEEHLEQELTGEAVGKPATGSLLLHLALAGAVLGYYYAGGFFKSTLWGGSVTGGAIRVQMTSAIPLPTDRPPNENVLATDKPSNTPPPPQPQQKEAPRVDDNAIPILGQNAKKQPPAQKTPKQQEPTKNNHANYGEMAANNLSRGVQGQSNPGPVAVQQGDFGSRFPWYVEGINRKMSTTWYKGEVDPKTPKGARVYLVFTIRRDGTTQNIQLDKSSNSQTLDRSCLRAAQRVDTFGPLPGGYSGNTLNVSYYCEY
jgi:protein TonB